MAKFLTQSISLALEQLQAAGNAAGGDYSMGASLPADCLITGSEINVTDALTGPGLVTATATFIRNTVNPAMADLTIPGTYQSGGLQVTLSIALVGCTMAQLLTGGLTALLYYDRYTMMRYQPHPFA